MVPAQHNDNGWGHEEETQQKTNAKVMMKEYDIILANRQIPNGADGDAKNVGGGTKHGAFLGLRIYARRSPANDPYSLRRRLLRTVLKRIAFIAFLCLPAAMSMRSVGPHCLIPGMHTVVNLQEFASETTVSEPVHSGIKQFLAGPASGSPVKHQFAEIQEVR